MAWAAKELRPILATLVEEAEREQVFAPQAVYGYWPAAAAGNDVILFDPADHAREVARFALPRQAKANGLCIADFLRDAAEPERDVIGLQVVTIGQRASEVARAWFAADRYNDYVHLHGLGVELAEALAEYVHKRIRAELGFSHLDARERARAAASRATAARATPSATPPAPTSPTSASCSPCSTPRASASSSPTRTSSTPSSRPRRSCCTTPRRATSTSEPGGRRRLRLSSRLRDGTFRP